MIQVHINDRNYISYLFSDSIDININPFNEKLFDGDFFSINDDKVEKIESTIRKISLQGILVLKGSKTYGSKDKKLLYKCIPNNKKLPYFLIPYHHKISFEKTFTNLFINFQFDNWTQKNPTGLITDVIGTVNDDNSYFEYELYCRNIHHSINKFSKLCIQQLKEKHICKEICIDNPFIFSIDPLGSTDFDDAFSVEENKIFIYISNVPVFLEKMNPNIWELFSDRVSTIYLPSSKKPMLPSILSDNFCSLQENTYRETIVLEIDIPTLSFSFFTKKIFISKNFVYEEKELINNNHYQLLFKNTRLLFSLLSDKYIEEINDSHELVCYLMILMNHHVGLRLNNGIFRITEKKENNSTIPNELKHFLNIWNSEYSGKYIFSSISEHVFHSQLNIYKYTHITSPIRRIVDIINLILFQQQMNLFSFSEKALQFVEKWIHKTELINENMKQIKKFQNKCNLISLKDEIVEGYIFYKISTNKYNVYLTKLKCYYSFSTLEDVEMYKINIFKIHIFDDEDKLNRRIRLSLIN
jgi:exoribonuclease R